MKCVQTVAGMLAIVGLGYVAGVGQSLLRDRPVILGAPSKPIIQPSSIGTNAPQQDLSAATPVSEPDKANPDQPNNPDFDARLDAPVPAGMLTLRQAHQLWIEGAYFIDSRHRDEYDNGHVSGAAFLTAETFFTDEGEAILATIPPDAPVVIYCVGGEQCDASHNTKALLEQSLFTDLHIMGVGYDEWAAAGLPTGTSQEEGSP